MSGLLGKSFEDSSAPVSLSQETRILVEKFKLLLAPYSAVLSDFDGTAVMSEQMHAEVGCRILNNHGVPDITFQERFAMMGFGEHGIHKELERQGRAPTITPEEFKNLQAAEFIAAVETMRKEQILRPGFDALVIAARELGKPFYIVSNTAREAVEVCMKVTGLDALIEKENVITFDDIQEAGLKKKPEPDPYILAIQRTGIANGKFLALEDSEVGVASAQATARNGFKLDIFEIYYDSIGRKPSPMSVFTVPDSGVLTDYNRTTRVTAVPELKPII